MNRNELVASVAEKTGLTKVKAGETIDAVLSTLAGAAKARDKVVLPGWLSLSVVDRDEREARNPANGQTIKVPAKTVVKLKAGKNFLA